MTEITEWRQAIGESLHGARWLDSGYLDGEVVRRTFGSRVRWASLALGSSSVASVMVYDGAHGFILGQAAGTMYITRPFSLKDSVVSTERRGSGTLGEILAFSSRVRYPVRMLAKRMSLDLPTLDFELVQALVQANNRRHDGDIFESELDISQEIESWGLCMIRS